MHKRGRGTWLKGWAPWEACSWGGRVGHRLETTARKEAGRG